MNSWEEFLNKEKEEPYFINLTNKIKEERKQHLIFPKEEDIFRAFKLSPLEKTVVLFLGQDPYHEINQANGLAFSVNDGVKLPPSLVNIYKELSDDLNIEKPTTGNLSKVAKQGILFLNETLTVQEHYALSHKNYGWSIFSDKVIKILNDLDRPIVFILLGDKAGLKAKLITNPIHLVLQYPHPSPLSAYRGFFGSKIFSKTNQFLEKHYKKTIDWNVLNK